MLLKNRYMHLLYRDLVQPALQAPHITRISHGKYRSSVFMEELDKTLTVMKHHAQYMNIKTHAFAYIRQIKL